MLQRHYLDRIKWAVAGAVLATFGMTMVQSLAAKPAVPPSSPPQEPALRHPVSIVLHRVNIVPGKEQRVDEWMAFLKAHHAEAVATLDRERTYFEAMFKAPDEPGKLYWLEIKGAGGESSKTSTFAVDHKHREYRDSSIRRETNVNFTTLNTFVPPFIVEAVARHQLGER